MAKIDSTRQGLDLSPWLDDPMSIFQASRLWVEILPNMPEDEARKRYPESSLIAIRWRTKLEAAAQSGGLAYEKPVPTKREKTGLAVGGSAYLGTPSRPATYRTIENWPAAHVALVDLRDQQQGRDRWPGL